MSRKRKPGQNEDSESAENASPAEEPTGAPDRLEKLYKLIEVQSKVLVELTGKLAETSTGLEEVKAHQDQSDAAIIEVAKKVGGGGVGKGGEGLLATILPILMQPRGPGPMEKIAMNMFLRNMSFSTLVTDRLAKRQFGEAYTNMVKEMESELYGKKGEGSE